MGAGELTAVASRSQESADEYAHHWDIPQTFASYETMLASDVIDAVYISLPNHLHAEWAIRALQAGKHVLCEKPFALTLADVDRMIATAVETGLVLAEAFMYRHHPQMKLVEEFVQDGRLGDITLIQSVFNFQFKSRDNIRLVPEFGGGCLWDVGIYPVSFAQFVMGGPPERVISTQWVGDSGVDEFFAGQMQYAHGRVAQISSSFATPFHTRSVIIGTKGRLRMSRPFTAVEDSEMVFFPAEGEPEFVDIPEEPLYLGEIEDMHRAILDGKANALSLIETRNHIRTVLALYESAVSGNPVPLI
ncbi:MAG: Gfo/Idh/MocA family oxidoreductase [Anaerolineae bacterium]|nr:Gfo/Idh/MocA family oxidoreductase [Anaerolineae bacterium]